MFDDILDTNREKMEKECRKCGSEDIGVTNKTFSSTIFADSKIYTRYKVFILCNTCGATYYISVVE